MHGGRWFVEKPQFFDELKNTPSGMPDGVFFDSYSLAQGCADGTGSDQEDSCGRCAAHRIMAAFLSSRGFRAEFGRFAVRAGQTAVLHLEEDDEQGAYGERGEEYGKKQLHVRYSS